jgi:hypothetical protein
MCKKLIYLISLVLVLSFACTSYTSAAITYVDATNGETGNTTLARGEVFTPIDVGSAGSGADGLWRVRVFANAGTIFEAVGDWAGESQRPARVRLLVSFVFLSKSLMPRFISKIYKAVETIVPDCDIDAQGLKLTAQSPFNKMGFSNLPVLLKEVSSKMTKFLQTIIIICI